MGGRCGWNCEKGILLSHRLPCHGAKFLGAPGQVHATWHDPVVFHPKRYHRTLPWTGSRYAVVAYTARSWTDAHGDREITDNLKELHFPLQKAPSRESSLLLAATGLEDALEEKTEPDSNVMEVLTPEDRDAIMAVYDDFAKGLQEIFEVFPHQQGHQGDKLVHSLVGPDVFGVPAPGARVDLPHSLSSRRMRFSHTSWLLQCSKAAEKREAGVALVPCSPWPQGVVHGPRYLGEPQGEL